MNRVLLVFILSICRCAPSVTPMPLEDYAPCIADTECAPGAVCRAWLDVGKQCRPSCQTYRDCPVPTGSTAAAQCINDHLCALLCLDVHTTICPFDQQCAAIAGSPPYGYCR